MLTVRKLPNDYKHSDNEIDTNDDSLVAWMDWKHGLPPFGMYERGGHIRWVYQRTMTLDHLMQSYYDLDRYYGYGHHVRRVAEYRQLARELK